MMLRMTCGILAAFLAALPALQGQEPEGKDGQTGKDLWVEVALKNGSVLAGVARSGRLCERALPTEYRFAPCKRSHPQAGIRLWYLRGMDGVMFLEYKKIAKVTVIGVARVKRVTPVRQTPRPASRPSEDGGDGKDGQEGKEGGGGLTRDERELLERFPPDEGWSDERFGEIQRRRILEERTPRRQEQEFVDAFERWRTAREKSRKSAVGKGKPSTGPKRRTVPGRGSGSDN